ncbi:unnamed protein product [Eruca vesicaria subsp. sativa]|uniref:Ethylene insensitive 3-like DNA-binding domain-containing protein n=1 Tax=Eruca vesicaria subsp. sativa TaxID=29727 RepID=A0ABC8JSG3_ERUVS|nr:unnamed protein product [Eruca vesicaria subsp. sativa]
MGTLGGNIDFFSSSSLGELDFCPAPHPEPDSVIEEGDYTDEEIDVEELEKRMWRDKLRLKRLKEQKDKTKQVNVDSSKQQRQQSQEKARRKKMSRAQDGILKYMLKMMEVCKAQGFVYGIIPENGKPVTGASDNLREWWKDKVRFDRNGPAAISGGSYSLLMNDCSQYNVEGFEKEMRYEVEEVKPEKVMNNTSNFIVKEEVSSDFMRKRKPSSDLNTIMDRTVFTCENPGCVHSDISRGFLDRNSRDNHQLGCLHRDSCLPCGGGPSRFHVNEAKPVVGFSNSVDQPIDLTGIGVPEDGQKMISELMSMYDRNVQSNQTSMVMENQSVSLLQPTVQNHQEHLQFQGSFFEDFNIPNRADINSNNQTFFQGNNNNINGFNYDTTHNNNNNFEAANSNSSSNRFQGGYDSAPFDIASIVYRDDMSVAGVVGMMDGMQQKQQDLSVWF